MHPLTIAFMSILLAGLVQTATWSYAFDLSCNTGNGIKAKQAVAEAIAMAKNAAARLTAKDDYTTSRLLTTIFKIAFADGWRPLG